MKKEKQAVHKKIRSIFAKTKALDFFFCGFSLLALLFFTFRLGKSSATGKKTVIVGSPKGEYVFPLEKDASYTIPGALGISTITVSGGKAFFADSPCPNKTCVQQGAISKNGEWAACLPNDVFLRIEAAQEVDALAF